MLEVESLMQRYDVLPQTTRDYFSSSAIQEPLQLLETQYDVPLATLMIALLVGEMGVSELATVLREEYQCDDARAEEIAQAIREQLMPLAGRFIPQITNPTPRAASVRSATVPRVYQKKATWDELVDRVIAEQQATFVDSQHEDRYRALVITALKEIRTPSEFRALLMRPTKIGGMEYTSQQADAATAAVASIIDSIKRNVTIVSASASAAPRRSQSAVSVSEQAAEAAAVVPRFRASSYTPRASVLTQHQQSHRQPIHQSVAAPLASHPQHANPLEATWAEFTLPAAPDELLLPAHADPRAPMSKKRAPDSLKPQQKPAAPVVEKRPIPRMTRPMAVSDDTARPKVADVTIPERVVGPIDELRNLTLKEFRRLSADPASASNIIKSKIDLLEEETYEKRTLGIAAWRKSKLYQMYVTIGKEAFDQGRPIETHLSEQTIAHPDTTLTLAEFQAISDLNRQLRF